MIKRADIGAHTPDLDDRPTETRPTPQPRSKSAEDNQAEYRRDLLERAKDRIRRS